MRWSKIRSALAFYEKGTATELAGFERVSGRRRKLVRVNPHRRLPRASGSPERIRDLLLVALGVTTGATDATGFERLGHVFAGVVTGNLVLLGIGGVRRDGSLALAAGCAVVGYVLGVLAASSGRRHNRDEEQRLWPPGVTVALASVGVLLLVFTVGWEATGGHPGREVQAVLLPIVAVAMGAQTSAVRRLGPLSTAYLTGTLTALLEGLADREWSTEESRGVAIIIAAIAGAATATLVIDHSPASLPLVPLVPLTVVVLVSRRLIGAESCGPTAVGGKMRGPDHGQRDGAHRSPIAPRGSPQLGTCEFAPVDDQAPTQGFHGCDELLEVRPYSKRHS
jgi:uncharacterized membrane protein YoaK (UPF0700 family)